MRDLLKRVLKKMWQAFCRILKGFEEESTKTLRQKIKKLSLSERPFSDTQSYKSQKDKHIRCCFPLFHFLFGFGAILGNAGDNSCLHSEITHGCAQGTIWEARD